MMVTMGVLASSCVRLRIDDLAKTGARNELAAIRDARGHSVEAEGVVTELRRALDSVPATSKRRDTAHSPCVELKTDAGTPVRCFLDATHTLGEFAPGARVKLVGKFYDFQQEGDATLVILQRCHLAK